MHRTTFVPCVWRASLVLAALCLAGFDQRMHAAQPESGPVVVEIPLNTTKKVQMSKKQIISEVRVENPRVARVQTLLEDPTSVLVTAVGVGSTRVALADKAKGVEEFEVVVPPDTPEKGPELPVIRLRMFECKPIRMSRKQAIKNIQVEDPAIASAGLENDKTVKVCGECEGRTLLSLTDTKGKKEDWLVEVYLDKVQQLRRILRCAVPNAAIEPVLIQEETNQYILTGTVPTPEVARVAMEAAKAFAVGGNVVNGLRVGGVQQVQIDVTVARVNRREIRNMSFSWLYNDNNSFLSSTVGGNGLLQTAQPNLTSSVFGRPTSSNAVLSSLSGSPNIIFGILDWDSFNGYLNALRTEGLAKLMACPKVVTLSGRPAQIASGGQTPVLTASQNGQNVEYKTFGTVVDVLPIVLDNGKIYLEVQPQVSALNAAFGITITTGFGQTIVPGFDIRSAYCSVEIETGQTLAIGGLIQTTMQGGTSKVPILGDLPFFGAAFRSVSYDEIEEELLILVTPRLVDPMDCAQAPKYLPGQETRSPDDFELFLEGILEAPRGPRNVCPSGCYVPAYKNSPSMGKYPCGPGGGYLNFDPAQGGACGPNGCGHEVHGHGHVGHQGNTSSLVITPMAPQGATMPQGVVVPPAPAPRVLPSGQTSPAPSSPPRTSSMPEIREFPAGGFPALGGPEAGLGVVSPAGLAAPR